MILGRKVARSDDDDRDLSAGWMLLHLRYELKSIHFWHHQIEKDNVRNAFAESVDCDTSIFGLDHRPIVRLQPGANELALRYVILDDQDPGWAGGHSVLRNQVH